MRPTWIDAPNSFNDLALQLGVPEAGEHDDGLLGDGIRQLQLHLHPRAITVGAGFSRGLRVTSGSAQAPAARRESEMIASRAVRFFYCSALRMLSSDTTLPDVRRPLRRGLTREDVPEWLRFPFLNRGYRHGGNHWTCFLSLFSLHTETLNCWTFVFALAFSTGGFAYASSLRLSYGDWAPFLSFYISCLVHAPISIGYHLFLCISPETYWRWRTLDVCFIFVASNFLTFALAFFVLPYWATGVLHRRQVQNRTTNFPCSKYQPPAN